MKEAPVGLDFGIHRAGVERDRASVRECVAPDLVTTLVQPYDVVSAGAGPVFRAFRNQAAGNVERSSAAMVLQHVCTHRDGAVRHVIEGKTDHGAIAGPS